MKTSTFLIGKSATEIFSAINCPAEVFYQSVLKTEDIKKVNEVTPLNVYVQDMQLCGYQYLNSKQRVCSVDEIYDIEKDFEKIEDQFKAFVSLLPNVVCSDCNSNCSAKSPEVIDNE